MNSRVFYYFFPSVMPQTFFLSAHGAREKNPHETEKRKKVLVIYTNFPVIFEH
jgi:hypothetical protein